MTSRPDFDNIARAYRWMEYATLGRALERCRFHFLPELRDRRQALVFGDGDGRFLARLLAGNPWLHADAVDSSVTMLKLLRAQCAAGESFDPPHRKRQGRDGWGTQAYQVQQVPIRNAVGGRLATHHMDALDFLASATPALGYDLVATHFFLDCLTQDEVEALAEGVAARLAPGAVWVVSEFRIPEGRMRAPAKLLVGGLYLAFRILTGLRTRRLPDHASALARAGFVCGARRDFLFGLIFAELWKLGEAESHAVG